MLHYLRTLETPSSRDSPWTNSQSSPDTKKNFFFHPLTLLGYPLIKERLGLALKYSQLEFGLGFLNRLNKCLKSLRKSAYFLCCHSTNRRPYFAMHWWQAEWGKGCKKPIFSEVGGEWKQAGLPERQPHKRPPHPGE